VQWNQRLVPLVFGLHLIHMISDVAFPANGACFSFVHNQLQALGLVRVAAFLRFTGTDEVKAADDPESDL